MAKKSGKKWKKARKASDKTLQRGRPDDIIIPVMGTTGVGKSTFINSYFGDNRAKTSDSYNSCTSVVEDYAHVLPSKRRIILVDTPGFNDSHEDETEILRRIAVWLASAYDEGTKVAGIIYLHDLSGARMYGSARMNLTMFQRLCGPDFFIKVIMATSRWDTLKFDVALKREQELKDTFWRPILEMGGTTRRLIDRPMDVRAAVNTIVAQHMRNESHPRQLSNSDALVLQQELVELDKSIPMTQAGKELKGTLKDLLDALKQSAADEGDPIKKEQLRHQLDLVKSQVQNLNIPFGERIKRWFGL